MKVEVIETIGESRRRVFGNVLEALKACGINGKVVVVNNAKTKMKYGITTTPALVINGVVMFAGNLLSTEEILKLLQQNLSTFT
jgi:protein-disulfide isomerase